MLKCLHKSMVCKTLKIYSNYYVVFKIFHNSFCNLMYSKIFKISSCSSFRILYVLRRFNSYDLENDYNEAEKEKILKTLNGYQESNLSRYKISKPRLTNISEWVAKNGQIKRISDVELIKGFTVRTAKNLFNSIIDEAMEESKIKKLNNILYPNLESKVHECFRSTLAVHVTSYSICWAFINRSLYEVQEWEYYNLGFRENKKMKITDIYKMVWEVFSKFPQADLYVMQSDLMTLQVYGSNSSNPKLMNLNLHKTQIASMLVALINSRKSNELDGDDSETYSNKIYFLQSSLPFRLYEVLIGNERVSTLKVIENLLQNAKKRTADKSIVYIPEYVQKKFRSNTELERDMLGQCLLLGVTFMDLCVYHNMSRAEKLFKT